MRGAQPHAHADLRHQTVYQGKQRPSFTYADQTRFDHSIEQSGFDRDVEQSIFKHDIE